ncbi:hypothetical protein AMS68_005528 [Peltaster fructicola]|uniref:C2 domain-containing protein n=1 Tax=Peltaster fructicola TaxID=286661 RepID=A0A6H0XZB5_9PEZI|nr:hypothetical protein AMS68_005528 [Peltaster fructicola]
MAAKLAPSQPAMMSGQHTSGIFADMSVDGPEIGTLVAIVDRAKNLPNRKSMGKQSVYCAARLGKEAKKTETDKRGGQTPRWDQELRFTVHDSLDYHNLKISVFSEDKRTDLVGEAWVNLDTVIVAGGGKSDVWQSLSFKGKYAGELRIELTYYDSRPKPERRAVVEEDTKLRQSGSERVKRRPLPVGPDGARGSLTPDTIPLRIEPGRAKHGPRDLNTPQRANSLPIEAIPQAQLQPAQQQTQYYNTAMHPDAALPIPVHTEYDETPMEMRGYEDPYAQPDFLPALPPAPRQRAVPASRYAGVQSTPPTQRPVPHPSLPHAHSDPVIPQHPDYYEEPEDRGLYTAAPEPLPDLDYQHRYVQQRHRGSDASWNSPHDQYPQHYRSTEAYDEAPPQPPSHSRSTSALPTLPSPHSAAICSKHVAVASDREESTRQPPTQASPHAERYDSSPMQTPSRGERYGSSPVQPAPRVSPYAETPPQLRGMPRSSQPQVSPVHRQSPHPLSQEVHRARSPALTTPIVKPRAISPSRQPEEPPQSEWRRKSTYSIQNPVRAFESSDESPLSRSRPQTSTHSTPRKSVSPHPPPVASSFAGGVPFGPDSFDVHNPAVRHKSDPDSPYDQGYNEGSKRTITAWDGREIDPSDHLPVASWAPEPEVKTPSKTYGLGRDRDFGPRAADSSATRISKDTMVNVRRRGQSTDATPSATIRARIVKKSANNSPITPLGEHTNYNPVPDPYAQQDYSRGFTNGSPGVLSGQKSSYDSYSEYGGPELPPKVPLGQTQDMYGQDALSREIASIDIGSAPRQRTQAPIAYVPVKSHRDRNSFY